MQIDFNLDHPEKELSLTGKKIAGLSISRLVLFFALLAVVIVGLSEMRWLLFLFFPMSILFVYLIKRFNTLKDRQAFLKAVIQIKEDENLRKSRKLASFDQGQEFIDKKHPFSNDLDLFGEHSLFQLLNHTVSKEGRLRLANEMKTLVSAAVAEKRFDAIKELSIKSDFLLHFEAFGKAFLKDEKPKIAFYDWIKTGNQWKKGYYLPLILGPMAGLFILSAVLFGLISPVFLSVWLLISLIALSLVFKPLIAAANAMPNEGDVKTFTAWAILMENLSFEDPYLVKLQQPIFEKNFRASVSLRSLEQQSFAVQNRANLVYMIFNFLFWVDYIVLLRLEKWKIQNESHIHLWQQCFDEWQVMVSLAAFEKEEKNTTAVQWVKEPTLKVKAIRHPLILPDSCVPNDFNLPIEDKIVLLTGSNMSGKTTFMRTVGTNMVLVNLGLSPFAEEYISGDFQLFTSMRNTDNLGESVSSFYAELARIKGLLDQAEQDKPMFFLLDEILKGTNTTDRVMGSEALIRQLSASQSKGIISTHDIELADRSLPGVVNYSFHSDIKDDKILFDYTLKKGPCPSFNAHKLMELMGIKFL
ncbi:MutS-related protein [Anditalea andensis]|uniref:DNA mismatch repair protein n=1 Tax=Anditalea andensis TaxID=1048983 RepID=A0A074KXF1_9BACT|nr:DNA mismatch repair protein [Anditalea andensis]KEO73604.1 DNA mismatch repair protein [Anditalea andensis]